MTAARRPPTLGTWAGQARRAGRGTAPRPQGGRPGMAAPRMPRRVAGGEPSARASVTVPAWMRDQVDASAAARGTSPAEWLRGAIAAQLMHDAAAVAGEVGAHAAQA